MLLKQPSMTSEAIALLAAISYALFTVLRWLGLQYSTPLAATIVSLLARTVTLYGQRYSSLGASQNSRASLWLCSLFWEYFRARRAY